MARMIPASYDTDTTSEGEIKLFKALETLPADCVILHSLGLAAHQHKVFGEIDFVIISHEGVLCLEVKGGRVYRRDGEWHFVNRFGRINKKLEGPFDQGLGAMHSLRSHIIKRFGNSHSLARCLYATGVAFPDMEFTQAGPDIIAEVVFDSRMSFTVIHTYINRVFSYWRTIIRDKHGFMPSGLTKEQIDTLAGYLRGDFGYSNSLNYAIDQTELGLIRLTDEQVERLSMAGENPRILLAGGAGTGKTILGMEYARRAALRGKRVLFLCFNRLLAQFLRKQQELVSDEQVLIRHFHGYLIEVVRPYRLDQSEEYHDSRYFQTELTNEFCSVFETYDLPKFDVVVLDEGQDLVRYEYLMCIDLLLEGGLKSGHWHIAYDPNQNIYNSSEDLAESLALIEDRCVKLSLDTNCRNTRPIGIYTTLMTGILPAHRFKLDGLGVEKTPYDDKNDQRRKVFKRLRNLLGQGVKPGDICILSHRTLEQSCLGQGNMLEEIGEIDDLTRGGLIPSEKRIKFSTVHSFKGLESPVVILIDVEGFMRPEDRIINYVGMSRAKSLLCVYYNANAIEELNEVIRNSAKKLDEISESV